MVQRSIDRIALAYYRLPLLSRRIHTLGHHIGRYNNWQDIIFQRKNANIREHRMHFSRITFHFIIQILAAYTATEIAIEFNKLLDIYRDTIMIIICV